MDDHKIIHLLKTDPDKGVEYIMSQYGGLLMHLVQNTGIMAREDQEECISDILYHVWRKTKLYDENKSSFKTWLILLARGCSVDYIRKHKKLIKSIPLETLEDLKGIKGEERLVDILDLLQQLPYPDHEIFFKRFIMGQKPATIAKELELSVDNVYKRIQRGRDTLKQLIEQEGF